MVQVYVKKKNLEEPFKIAELIVLKELPIKKDDYEVVKLKVDKIPVKKALLKLIKKGKYNAKYLEERIPVPNVKRTIHYRNTGLF